MFLCTPHSKGSQKHGVLAGVGAFGAIAKLKGVMMSPGAGPCLPSQRLGWALPLRLGRCPRGVAVLAPERIQTGS